MGRHLEPLLKWCDDIEDALCELRAALLKLEDDIYEQGYSDGQEDYRNS